MCKNWPASLIITLHTGRPQATMPRPLKSRHWTFTLNNYKSQEVDLNIKTISYFIIGEEIADLGTPHLQGYICFKQQLRLTQVSKLLPRARLAIKYKDSTPYQAAHYCKKDNKYVEYGTLPLTKEQSTMQRWDDARANAIIGDFDQIPSDMIIRYYHSLKRLHQDNPIRPKRLDKLQNYWIVAPTRYGKSYYAREKYPDYYDKPPNKWFVGYKNESTILLDDLGPQQCQYLTWYLKRWADIYSFPIESKGGGKQIRSKHIIVTSQYTIEQSFEDSLVIQAISKRFTTVHLPHWKNKHKKPFLSIKYHNTVLYNNKQRLFQHI